MLHVGRRKEKRYKGLASRCLLYLKLLLIRYGNEKLAVIRMDCGSVTVVEKFMATIICRVVESAPDL